MRKMNKNLKREKEKKNSNTGSFRLFLFSICLCLFYKNFSLTKKKKITTFLLYVMFNCKKCLNKPKIKQKIQK